MIDGVINTPYSLILIAVMAAVTAFVRFSPFILFPEGRKRPRVITYLGTVLPYAVIGMLVVYCFKGKSLIEYPYCIPELLAAPDKRIRGRSVLHGARSARILGDYYVIS